MKGCLVMDAEIIDTKAYSKLVRKVPAAVAAHGGRILVRTSSIGGIQGGWMPKRFGILEFDSPQCGKGGTSAQPSTQPCTTFAVGRRRPTL